MASFGTGPTRTPLRNSGQSVGHSVTAVKLELVKWDQPKVLLESCHYATHMPLECFPVEDGTTSPTCFFCLSPSWSSDWLRSSVNTRTGTRVWWSKTKWLIFWVLANMRPIAGQWPGPTMSFDHGSYCICDSLAVAPLGTYVGMLAICEQMQLWNWVPGQGRCDVRRVRGWPWGSSCQ